ncbi:MAG: hypothetical protein WBD56_09170, partial [Anaerolineales bacterium]
NDIHWQTTEWQSLVVHKSLVLHNDNHWQFTMATICKRDTSEARISYPIKDTNIYENIYFKALDIIFYYAAGSQRCLDMV